MIFAKKSKLPTSSQRYTAFTLAEVLITLGIIGVVAAMTIPALVKNYQEKVIVSQLKRVYSTLGSAYANVKNEEGEPNTWNVTCINDLANLFAPYLKTEIVYAPANGYNGSFTKMGYSALPVSLDNQSGVGFYPQIKLSSGETIFFSAPWFIPSGLACQQPNDFCFWIMSDINGAKKPNRFGVDIFAFNVRPKSLFPTGDLTGTWPGSLSNYCDPSTNPGTWFGNGEACTAWVLQKENLDYLKCIDEGKASYCHQYGIN